MKRVLMVVVMLLVVPIVSANPCDEIVRMTREIEKQNADLRAQLDAIHAKSVVDPAVAPALVVQSSVATNQVGFRIPDKTTGKMTLEVAWPPADSNKPVVKVERSTTPLRTSTFVEEVPIWLLGAVAAVICMVLGVLIAPKRRVSRPTPLPRVTPRVTPVEMNPPDVTG